MRRLIDRLSFALKCWLHKIASGQDIAQEIRDRPIKGMLDPTAIAFTLKDKEEKK